MRTPSPTPRGMALIMARDFAGRGMLRAAVLIPWAIPTAVTAKLWQFIFADYGIANKMLAPFTDEAIRWTTDPWAARGAVIVADVWKTAPFMALLVLAGLQTGPRSGWTRARWTGRGSSRTCARATSTPRRRCRRWCSCSSSPWRSS